MGWAEVVIVALVIVIALLFLLNRAARPLASPSPPAVRPALDAHAAQQITELVSAGKKIEAVKQLRAATGLGLREAKNWIDHWDGGASAREASPTTEDSAVDQHVLAVEARAVRQASGAITAIKFVRERTGWGLAEAKEFVDRLD